MNFELAYSEFIRHHVKSRQSDARRHLTEGLGHAEKLFLQQVWWPAFSNFDNLVPEYEIQDFRDGTRFLDFAFTREHVKLAIEIDGYGPHLQNITRSQFSDQWIRQNHLLLDGWKLLRFSFDDVKDKPRMCEQMIHQFMGKWFGTSHSGQYSSCSFEDKEIIRMALLSNRKVKPNDVCSALNVEQQKARSLLHSLLSRGILIPGGRGKQRIHIYHLSHSITAEFCDL
ncbi:hypothetical protein [Paenibacillus sp. Soil724D2]|uniref:hypothetical protein n=1 Tax=Paenibacillus sp. (strain Soil724D2) TaxID=1736392 RepID=UPI000713B115|nr:hypothetical protein [Paenibacillus sp. Soil724D2]KRE32304.1 hypothetical protein ASG85_16545 [Paenibacillus sp. Soil724D2]